MFSPTSAPPDCQEKVICPQISTASSLTESGICLPGVWKQDSSLMFKGGYFVRTKTAIWIFRHTSLFVRPVRFCVVFCVNGNMEPESQASDSFKWWEKHKKGKSLHVVAFKTRCFFGPSFSLSVPHIDHHWFTSFSPSTVVLACVLFSSF